MANMSDLDTTGIGIIAFWNALDHWTGPGANEIDPTDCIAIFSSYDVYDNGIEGYKALGSGRYFHARVKSDGWMVAWIDRTNTFAYPNKAASDFGEDAHKGYYDILWDWIDPGANISSTQTTLSYLISLLYNSLSNKTDFTFSDADVGHYCYEYRDANVLTLTSKKLHVGLPWGITVTYEGFIRYTAGTNIYHAAVAASLAAPGSYSSWGKVKFAGNLLIDHQTAGYASANIEDWMPNPLTDYSVWLQGFTKTIGDTYCSEVESVLILWK